MSSGPKLSQAERRARGLRIVVSISLDAHELDQLDELARDGGWSRSVTVAALVCSAHHAHPVLRARRAKARR